MLVFSREHEISILPALPAKWRRGHVHGVATRAGVIVSIDWDVEQNHFTITLEPRIDNAVTIQLPSPATSITLHPATVQLLPSSLGKRFKCLVMRMGEAVTLEIVMGL
ncbi:MAG: hypothetical protein JW839_10525 [Candidatus Lokiarchaeota archaeon]|nr:hypothetical protein [Candidatus Lokiarchaeota archaeon]